MSLQCNNKINIQSNYLLKVLIVMLSNGFPSNAMNFHNVEGSLVRMYFFLQYCNTKAAEGFSDLAATMQLQWYNHSYVIMGTGPDLDNEWPWAI